VLTAGDAAGAKKGAAKKKAKKKKKKKRASNKARTFQIEPQAPVPDRTPGGFVGQLNSTINVGKKLKGKEVARVEVSVRLTHPDLDDVDLFLVSPEGALVFLTGDNDGIGGLATSYGSGAASCSGTPTTFTDLTPNWISNADVAIYSGETLSPWATRVQPDGYPLNIYEGQRASGAWTLRVTDFDVGVTAVLHCWKLLIKPRNPLP